MPLVEIATDARWRHDAGAGRYLEVCPGCDALAGRNGGRVVGRG